MTEAQQRSYHHGPRGCMTTMSSRGCPGCDGGVPYPRESMDAWIGRIGQMAAAREMRTNKESSVKTQKIDSAPKPTKKPATAFHLEAGARQQLLARIAGDVAAGVVTRAK